MVTFMSAWFINPGYANAAIKDNLLVYYELGESGSSDRVDSEDSNDLTAVNTPTNVTGIQGNADSFAEASSERLELAHGSKTTATGGMADLTVQVWVNINTAPSTNETDQVLNAWSGVGGNTARPYTLNYRNAGGTKRLQWDIDDGTAEFQCRKNVDLGTGSWKHIVVVYDSETSGGTQEIYVNGSSLGTCTSVGNFSIANGTHCFSIAGRAGGADCASMTAFGAMIIDEVAVWSRALTTTEITCLYATGSGVAFADLASTCDAGGGSAVTVIKVPDLPILWSIF